MVPLVKTPRFLTRSVAAPAKDQCSVLMKGVGDSSIRGSFASAAALSPASTPIAATAGAYSVTGPDPQQPRKPLATLGHNVRRAFFDGIYGIGFTRGSPLEIGLMSRARISRCGDEMMSPMPFLRDPSC